MALTYEPISTTTLGSAAASITFSSIPSTYTDLRLVLVATATSATLDPRLTFNSDTGTNYSFTYLYGDGTNATSGNSTTRAYILLDRNLVSTTVPHFYTMDIFSYAGSTNKTSLHTMSEDDNGSGFVARQVSLWRSTSAINRIDINTSTNTFATGTTATLYGITKA